MSLHGHALEVPGRQNEKEKCRHEPPHLPRRRRPDIHALEHQRNPQDTITSSSCIFLQPCKVLGDTSTTGEAAFRYRLNRPQQIFSGRHDRIPHSTIPHQSGCTGYCSSGMVFSVKGFQSGSATSPSSCVVLGSKLSVATARPSSWHLAASRPGTAAPAPSRRLRNNFGVFQGRHCERVRDEGGGGALGLKEQQRGLIMLCRRLVTTWGESRLGEHRGWTNAEEFSPALGLDDRRVILRAVEAYSSFSLPTGKSEQRRRVGDDRLKEHDAQRLLVGVWITWKGTCSYADPEARPNHPRRAVVAMEREVPQHTGDHALQWEHHHRRARSPAQRGEDTNIRVRRGIGTNEDYFTGSREAPGSPPIPPDKRDVALAGGRSGSVEVLGSKIQERAPALKEGGDGRKQGRISDHGIAMALTINITSALASDADVTSTLHPEPFKEEACLNCSAANAPDSETARDTNSISGAADAAPAPASAPAISKQQAPPQEPTPLQQTYTPPKTCLHRPSTPTTPLWTATPLSDRPGARLVVQYVSREPTRGRRAVPVPQLPRLRALVLVPVLGCASVRDDLRVSSLFFSTSYVFYS
ncbi:hypothetical protein C8J57DRAFT_1466333 [Mycena rebaudengoi]|nr:hypothetical protein C8J57DRAFT_1466333 [Mycena rebaudengoi]